MNETNAGRTEKFNTILKDLRVVFRAIQSHSRLVEQASGLSSAQLWMLWELSHAPGLKVSELARILSIHQSTCSNMLDKLEDKKLIQRTRGSEDQRIVRIFLSDAGNRLLAKAPRPAQGALIDALRRLPDITLDQLEAGLSDLAALLKKSNQDAGMEPMAHP